jgi:hypothetical protein
MKNIKDFFEYITENMDIKSKVSTAIDELKSLGYINPFNSREIVLHNASVEVSYFDGLLWLSSIYAHEKGAGSAAMKVIMDIASKHNLTIGLSPQPFGDNGLNKTQLKDWYKRLGFKTRHGRMVWTPENKSLIVKYKLSEYDVAVFKEVFESEGDPLYRAWVKPQHVISLNKLTKIGVIIKGVLFDRVMFYIDNTIDNPTLALELMEVVENKDSFFYSNMHRIFTKRVAKTNI